MPAIDRNISAKRNPYGQLAASGASLALGTEATNVRRLTVTLEGRRGRTARSPTHFSGYFSSDAAGLTPLAPHAMPSGGYASGGTGLLLPGSPPKDGLLAKGTLAIHSTPEQFKTTASAFYRVAGVQYTKAATTGLTFSAAHTVTASKFGVILVQVNAAGTVSTKVPATPQAYATAAAALAALPAPDAANAALGYILVAAKAALWTANTDDLTNGSDLTTATFVDACEGGVSPPTFSGVASAAGLLTVDVTETQARTVGYIQLRLPSGELATSPALAFA